MKESWETFLMISRKKYIKEARKKAKKETPGTNRKKILKSDLRKNP